MQHLLLVTTLSIATSAAAQLPQVSAGLVQSTTEPNVIQLRVKPTSEFNGLFSASVFTVRWPYASSLRIDSITQPFEASMYHPISVQGVETVDQHHRYSKFAGFGMTTLANASTQWVADSQYVIAEFHVSGDPLVGYFELINDSWTSEQNSDSYNELNGEDRTGSFFNAKVTFNVDLDEFTAVAQDNRHALLQWHTNGEYNTSHYDILRSADLVNWTLLESVPAANFSTELIDYGTMDSYIHPDDKSALTVYYMLRAVDVDGKVTEFGPETVTFTRDPLWNPYSVYPNPAADYVMIEAPVEWGALRYDLRTDISQQVIIGNLSEGGGRVDISNMPIGAIIVHVYDASGHPVMSRPVMHIAR